MTEAKFTKGPLHPVFNDHFWEVCVSPSRYAQSVAQIHVCAPLGIGHEESEANATLYAAAPELYEVLDGLHKTILNAFPNLSESGPMVAAAHALAKARGEQ